MELLIFIPIFFMFMSLYMLLRNYNVHTYNMLILDEIRNMIDSGDIDIKTGIMYLKKLESSKITYGYMLFRVWKSVKAHYFDLRRDIGLVTLSDIELGGN